MAGIPEADAYDETESEISLDVGFDRKLMLIINPEPLRRAIIDQPAHELDNDPTLIIDALQELDFYYEGDLSDFSTTQAILQPLRLAHSAPSEGIVPAKVTAIRLLSDIGNRYEVDPQLLTGYGEDVVLGITTLTQRQGESFTEHLQRIRQVDQENPELLLVPTASRRIILSAFDPVGLPDTVHRRSPTWTVLEAQLDKYAQSAPHLFLDRTNLWQAKIQRAIQMSRNA